MNLEKITPGQNIPSGRKKYGTENAEVVGCIKKTTE